MTRKTIVVLVLGLILLACLLACGYFGAKTVRRSYQRKAAMAAYEKKDYVEAERLLLRCLQKDPNSEPEIVALANIYREFGNVAQEAQMWQMAASLNPLNGDYRKNMLDAATKSAGYGLLYSAMGRKINMNEKLDDAEKALYVISSFRVGHAKEGKDFYKKQTEADRDAFHRSDLGRFAEYMVNADTLTPEKRKSDLNPWVGSEDPTVRFEALYSSLLLGVANAEEEEIEGLLKQLQETNYYAGTPILANYLFSRCRFNDFTAEAEKYLEKIDNNTLYYLLAESFVLTDKSAKLKALEEELRGKTGALKTIADYCSLLLAYLDNDEKKLAEETRKYAKLFSSPVFRFIRLRVAMTQGTYSEILAAANELFSGAPYYDLFDRAALLCQDYLARQMMMSENQADPSKMAELSKIVAPYLPESKLVSNILLADRYQKGLAKDVDILNALGKSPDDPLLLRISAEYLVLNNKPEQALPSIEKLLQLKKTDGTDVPPSPRVLFLRIVALDQTGKHEEASKLFGALVDQSEFDMGILAEYFRFCTEYKRIDDLNAMADKLDAVQDGTLKPYSAFFRASALLLTEDEAKRSEALDMLAATPDDDPMFAFYAANELSEAERLDAAEKKYKAILNAYPVPFLVYVNLSELYTSKGDREDALEAAKKGFELAKTSWLSSFIYARRLSEAGRYEEAVEVLNFPRRTEKFRAEVIELWCECMKKVIEKSIAEERYMQAEDQCKHLLVYAPDDAFAKESLEKVRKAMADQNKKPK